MNQDSQSSHQHKKESQILEGEVVGKIPQKERKHHHHTNAKFSVFQIPFFAKLRRNCLLSFLAFITLTILAIYFKNGWLFLLALIFPPWVFSQKKF